MQFASVFNGKAKILGKFATLKNIYSDASGWGYGAIHGSDWLIGTFNDTDTIPLKQYASHHYLEPDDNFHLSHINMR